MSGLDKKAGRIVSDKERGIEPRRQKTPCSRNWWPPVFP